VSLDPRNVSAVIPTRGDVDLTPILDSLPFVDVIVWDNSKRHDLGIFGRYHAIHYAKNPVIVTQDDDLIVTCWLDILDAYEPGVLTVNYPEPYDIPWVARGGIFDCDLPGRAFERYLHQFPFDEFFTHHACDGVFALLTDEVRVIDEGSEDLPHGLAEGRVSTSPKWYDERRPLIQKRCAEIQAVVA
jgi:hypothetical protein